MPAALTATFCVCAAVMLDSAHVCVHGFSHSKVPPSKVGRADDSETLRFFALKVQTQGQKRSRKFPLSLGECVKLALTGKFLPPQGGERLDGGKGLSLKPAIFFQRSQAVLSLPSYARVRRGNDSGCLNAQTVLIVSM